MVLAVSKKTILVHSNKQNLFATQVKKRKRTAPENTYAQGQTACSTMNEQAASKDREQALMFESELAFLGNETWEQNQGIHILANRVANYMERNKNTVNRAIEGNWTRILNNLYSDGIFGRIWDKPESANELREQLIAILRGEYPRQHSLPTTFQTLETFADIIFPGLSNQIHRPAFKEAVQILRNPKYFVGKDRSREVLDIKLNKIEHSLAVGISDSESFNRQYGQRAYVRFADATLLHYNALDRIRSTGTGNYEELRLSNNWPFVGSISGHTADVMALGLLFGLEGDELKELAFAAFSSLTLGRNHSFYEVMLVASMVGVEMHPKDYSVSIPDYVKATDEYADLAQAHPERLNPDEMSVRLKV